MRKSWRIDPHSEAVSRKMPIHSDSIFNSAYKLFPYPALRTVSRSITVRFTVNFMCCAEIGFSNYQDPSIATTNYSRTNFWNISKYVESRRRPPINITEHSARAKISTRLRARLDSLSISLWFDRSAMTTIA